MQAGETSGAALIRNGHPGQGGTFRLIGGDFLLNVSESRGKSACEPLVPAGLLGSGRPGEQEGQEQGEPSRADHLRATLMSRAGPCQSALVPWHPPEPRSAAIFATNMRDFA